MTGTRRWFGTIALLLVLAGACIPYGVEDPTHHGLNIWTWLATGLCWVTTAAVLGGLLIRRLRWLYDEAVFVSIGIYVAAAAIAASSSRLTAEARVALAVTFLGVTVGITAYWLELREDERA